MGLSDDIARQQRLQREQRQRNEAAREQAEFDRQNRERQSQQHDAMQRGNDPVQPGGTVVDPFPGGAETYPAKPKKQWFPFIDRKFAEFLESPKYASKIMGFLALVGLLTGLGYADSTDQSALGFGVLGALLGFMFLHLLKFALKVVLVLLMIGAVVGIYYALAHLGK